MYAVFLPQAEGDQVLEEAKKAVSPRQRQAGAAWLRGSRGRLAVHPRHTSPRLLSSVAQTQDSRLLGPVSSTGGGSAEDLMEPRSQAMRAMSGREGLSFPRVFSA